MSYRMHRVHASARVYDNESRFDKTTTIVTRTVSAENLFEIARNVNVNPETARETLGSPFPVKEDGEGEGRGGDFTC